MKKYIRNLTISEVSFPHERYVLFKLTDPVAPLPPMLPGQFVEIRVEGSPTTFLRRPISINYIDREANLLWLLIAMVGDGTRTLGTLKPGDQLNLLFPLGNGFSPMQRAGENVLLVGGGVGVAPLLEYGKVLKEQGANPIFLLGARTAGDLLLLDHFQSISTVYLTTEDGSMGEQGFVTQHSILRAQHFDRISCCGPKPMMMSVARYARLTSTPCEVSLENMMACGLGACLCCVEKTVKGNVCACTEGPVFNIDDLTWNL
ncbi:MAG: dihydroorotate dehydrogenase electron transfer subunit [Bacteroidaceae bacterium]|nr:dihydroorotate dehydrogenase electron transfer subunit [Bacteroidaceae bacterium]